MAGGKRKERLAAPTVDPRWISLLADINAGPIADEVPDGWVTIRELCKIWNVSYATANRQLKDLKEIGRVESKRFKIRLDVVRPVMHHRIIED